ncbi:MAG: PAS domain S-box protein [Candidatus Izemoplasmatales bacterium]
MSDSNHPNTISSDVFENLDSSIFRTFFQESKIGLSITSLDGKIRVNNAFCEMLGYSQEEIKSMRWQDITHPDDFQVSLNAIRSLTELGENEVTFEKRYLKKSGQPLWVEIHTSLSQNNDQERYLFTSITDISEKKRTHEELKRLYSISSSFFEASSDFLFIKDENLNHILLNRPLAEFYGGTIESIMGKNVHDLMDEASALACDESDHAAINGTEPVIQLESIQDRIYETRKFRIPLDKNKVGIGGYITDITDEFHTKQKLQMISRANQFVAEKMLEDYRPKEDLVREALDVCLEITQSQYGFVSFYHEERQEFTLMCWDNATTRDCQSFDRLPESELQKAGIWSEVVRTKKPLILNEFQHPDSRKKGYPEGHIPIQRFMSIPVSDRDHIVAIIGLANKEHPYNQDDAESCAGLMNGIWNTIAKNEHEKLNLSLLDRLRSMFNHHQAVMMLLDPETGKVMDANPAASRFYGYTEEELLQLHIHDINCLPPHEVSKLLQKAKESGQHYFTFPHRMKNGKIRTVDVYTSPVPYNDRQVLFSIIFDVTDREKAYSENEYISYHDYLTNLYNRRFFENEYLRRQEQLKFPLGIIMGDVNGLKLVNDSLGHSYGDQLLIKTAKLIRRNLPRSAIAARVGGDEFAILFSKTNEEAIRLVLKKIEDALWLQNQKEGEKAILSIAFGYAIQTKPEETLEVLMKEAEGYLYANKYYDDRSIKGKAITVIMNALFEKSAREKNHSLRVGKLSARLAETLGFDTPEVNRIRTAGYLHDIGKIGIQENILNKQGSLSSEEWEMMKSHSERSFRILQNSIEYSDVCEIVRYHHEHYDGSGYPKGLKKEEIPIEARIIAIADAFDAMTNQRSYKKKRSRQDALEEIRHCAGSQFDPSLSEAFIHLFDGLTKTTSSL